MDRPSAGTISSVTANGWDVYEGHSSSGYDDGGVGFYVMDSVAGPTAPFFSAPDINVGTTREITGSPTAAVGTAATIGQLAGYSNPSGGDSYNGVQWTASGLVVSAGEILYFVADPGHLGTDQSSNHDYGGGADNLALQVSLNFVPTPEPGSFVLLGLGGVGLALAAWKRPSTWLASLIGGAGLLAGGHRKRSTRLRFIFALLIAPLAVVATAVLTTARASELLVADSGSNEIGQYDATSGAAINPSLISGLNSPEDVEVSGADLYVKNYATGTVGEYTIAGATINASLVSGLSSTGGIAVSAGSLFAANDNSGAISQYNATSGAPIDVSLITGLDSPTGIAVSGGDLFITTYGTGTIGEYTTAGATINASLINDPGGPNATVVSGGDLFVTNYDAGTVGEYTTAGAVVNASLVTGLNSPTGIAVAGNDLFVASYGSGTIGEYNATSVRRSTRRS